ncbi:hypothetical protein TNCV_951321 [Trichonephila clavipes]|nr:hypothetical protein TNCV_951321 [Trichonephila clavipes]
MAVISEVSELSIQNAASELLVLHPPKYKIVEHGVSVDGTRQLRGYTSMNGCVDAADHVCYGNFQGSALKMEAVELLANLPAFYCQPRP